jgi:hypothetical protein
MSTPKPRIRPKAGPHRERSGRPPADPPAFPDYDPPVFTARDPVMERKTPERVVFQEDDCLR